jgi:DNA modification methylase
MNHNFYACRNARLNQRAKSWQTEQPNKRATCGNKESKEYPFTPGLFRQTFGYRKVWGK